MKKIPIIFFLLLFSMCKLNNSGLSIVTYTNTQNQEEYVFSVVGANNITTDSLIKSLLRSHNTAASLESNKLSNNESTNFVKDNRCNKRAERYFNKLNENTKFIRIIALKYDSTSQSYISSFDTLVVNSKDSVYHFHSR